jgi:hypothetical protein
MPETIAVSGRRRHAGVIGLVGWRSQPRSESLVVSAVLVWMILAAPLSEFHYLLVVIAANDGNGFCGSP